MDRFFNRIRVLLLLRCVHLARTVSSSGPVVLRLKTVDVTTSCFLARGSPRLGARSFLMFCLFCYRFCSHDSVLTRGSSRSGVRSGSQCSAAFNCKSYKDIKELNEKEILRGIILAYLGLHFNPELLFLKHGEPPIQGIESSLFVRQFSCKELKRATCSFSTIIGSGSHGVDYKAQFSDGLVAVVREVRGFQQEKDAFYEEVQLLTRLHHRHLVTFRGFSTGHDRFLVFDYMENGSVKDCLHDPLKTPLNWRTRLQIAVDVAAALDYLHSFCDPAVCQISVNSSNVLLDENFVAKLSDVGFLASEGNIPEVNATGPGDADQKFRHVIFQFGVLLLELITGQSFGNEDLDLVKWVQESAFTDSIHKMVDTDLGNSYNSRELKSLLIVARLCTKNECTPMITIQQLLRFLQRTQEPLCSSF